MHPEEVVLLKNYTIYQEENLILSNVDLTLKAGEFAYLVGKTGSGKSSLLKSLYAELKQKDGEAECVGYNLMKIKRRHIPYLRRKIGIVFQDFQLLSDRSVYDNLLFVMKATGWRGTKKMKEKSAQLLENVGLTGKENKMPHQLSGGEQQRVSIARALVNDPELILADEPTGNLDPETSAEILNLLFSISKNGKTVLMATHDYTIMERFPFRTLKCEDQKVSEVTPSALFNPINPIIS